MGPAINIIVIVFHRSTCIYPPLIALGTYIFEPVECHPPIWMVAITLSTIVSTTSMELYALGYIIVAIMPAIYIATSITFAFKCSMGPVLNGYLLSLL